MSNYLCVCSYLGAAYFGFERQKNHPSIQGKIEECLKAILHEDIKINASGRTDAKVNAKGQAFTFLSSSPLLHDDKRFLYAINHVLPNDIAINSLNEMPSSFHARYSASKKIYSYSFHLGEKLPFLSNEVAMLGNKPFSADLFKRAMTSYLGKHNFQDFTPKSDDQFSFERTIFDVSFESKDKDVRVVAITGDGFMTYQVRTMVGAALKVAFGKMTLEELRKRLEGEKRKIITFKAPAEGLCLEKVIY